MKMEIAVIRKEQTPGASPVAKTFFFMFVVKLCLRNKKIMIE